MNYVRPLTVDEFLDKLWSAKTWGIHIDPSTRRLTLVLGELPDDWHSFEGPDPQTMTNHDYEYHFLGPVIDIVKERAMSGWLTPEQIMQRIKAMDDNG